MKDNITSEELVKLAIHLANSKDTISFEELNAILFPGKWKEIEKLLYLREMRQANSDDGYYCD
jgi:hypothetical protein